MYKLFSIIFIVVSLFITSAVCAAQIPSQEFLKTDFVKSFQKKEYAQALYEAISETKPEDHDKVLDNFVKIIAQNGDLGKYPEIESEYQKLESKAQGIKQVEVTTATEVDAKSLIAELNTIVGKKIEITRKIDPEIIGGIVVRVDDTLIDASVKNNLNNLKKAIAQH